MPQKEETHLKLWLTSTLGACQGFTRSTRAFIFSLYNHRGFYPIRLRARDPNTALDCGTSHGPAWGKGNDLLLGVHMGAKSKAHTGFLGASYEIPPGYRRGASETKHFLSGVKNYFSPTDVEVFYQPFG